MQQVKQVTVDVQGNDTVVCLMAGAVYDLVDLLGDTNSAKGVEESEFDYLIIYKTVRFK